MSGRFNGSNEEMGPSTSKIKVVPVSGCCMTKGLASHAWARVLGLLREISFQIKSALYPFRTSKPMPFSNIAKSVPFIHLANGVSTFFNFEDLQDCQI